MDWGHTAVEWLGTISGTTVPIGLYLWTNKRKAKAENEKRHEENQEVIKELVTELKYFPSHNHQEKSGSLTVEGIKYPPGKE